MNVTKGQLRRLAMRLLVGATDAGDQVYSPSDWPTHDQQYPVLLVSVPHELKTATGGRGTVEFDCVATIRVNCRVEAPAEGNDRGAVVAEDHLERLELQVLRTLINNPALMAWQAPLSGQRIAAFPQIETQTRLTAEAEQHFAESQIDIAMEFAQGPEDFYDPDGVALTSMDFEPNTAVAEALQGEPPSLLITLPQS